VKVDEWNNNPLGVGGDVSAAPEPSTWRNAKLPFAPKDHPELRDKTIGEAFDNPATRNWAFGMLNNFKAAPYTAKDGTVRQPNQTAIDMEAAGLAWRIENGKDHT
jgi:hypothetical protein